MPGGNESRYKCEHLFARQPLLRMASELNCCPLNRDKKQLSCARSPFPDYEVYENETVAYL